MTTHTSRREFLTRGAGLGAVALGCPAVLRSASGEKKLNLAFIGVGGRGGSNIRTITRDPNVNVVALCDVNSQSLDLQSKAFPKARRYADFRKLYEDVRDVDAVVVSTCEHTHAYATLPALQAGKHVYCEKPLTYNVQEARIITEAAAKAGTVTQMGTQIHGMPNYRRVVELIQSGAIGDVSEVHVWVSRAWGRQSAADAQANKDIVSARERPMETVQPPDYLDWDLWIGPAPYRPFHPVYFPGPKWYRCPTWAVTGSICRSGHSSWTHR